MTTRVRVSSAGMSAHTHTRCWNRQRGQRSDTPAIYNSSARPTTLSARIGFTPSKIGSTCASAT